MDEMQEAPISRWLGRWREGDPRAGEQVLAYLYDDLRRIAGRHLRRERPGHTLQTTAVVHEACLKLLSGSPAPWNDRVHFLASAARMMRHILVNHARDRRRLKRGGGWVRTEVAELAGDPPFEIDVLAVHEALERLESIDRQKAAVVELKVFGGLSGAEVAEELGIAERTVSREWRRAKAWLHQALVGEGPIEG